MRLSAAVILMALLGGVYFVGATIFTDRIQRDISVRSNAAIAEVNSDVALAVSGRDVTLSGLVNTRQDREIAEHTVEAVWGVRASRNLLDIRDAYRFQATHYASEGLTIGGVVDSQAAIDHMRDAIAPVQPTGTVATNGRPMSASPEKLALGASTILMLMEGELDIDEKLFVVRGTAEDLFVKNAIEDKLNNRQNEIKPLTLITEIAIADTLSRACRKLIDESFANNKVLFAFDSAVIEEEFTGVINAHAKLLNKCPGEIIVEAHADHDGSETYNLQLSERRARAVVDAITSQGVESGRLHLFYYGETRPVASNESTGDKTFNRRVELQFVHQAHSAFTTLQQPIISSQSAE